MVLGSPLEEMYLLQLINSDSEQNNRDSTGKTKPTSRRKAATNDCNESERKKDFARRPSGDGRLAWGEWKPQVAQGNQTMGFAVVQGDGIYNTLTINPNEDTNTADSNRTACG